MDFRKKLESLTVDELRKRAKAAGHSGYSRLKKSELIDLLVADELAETEQTVESPKSAKPKPRQPGKPRTHHIFGPIAGLLQTAGVVGIAFSLSLLIALPAANLWLGAKLSDQLAATAGALEGVEDEIALISRNLAGAATALESGSRALRTTEKSLQGMDPLLDSVSELLADELPESIDSTQQALISAQDGAAAMDRVLRGLRLFGLDYNPDLPLDQSLAQTAESLEGLPEALRRTERDLGRSQQDLADVADDLIDLAGSLEDFSADLQESAVETQNMTAGLDGAAASLRAWSSRVMTWRWLSALVGILFGMWMGLLHLNLWVVGRLATSSGTNA